MKKVFLFLFAAMILVGCSENYSNGSRVGYVTKFSKKGLAIDTWECTLNTTQTGMNSGAAFECSVDRLNEDERIISTLDSALKNSLKVMIHYHELYGKNWFSNRGETDYMIDSVEVLDNQIGQGFSQDTSRSGRVVDTIYVVIDKSK